MANHGLQICDSLQRIAMQKQRIRVEDLCHQRMAGYIGGIRQLMMFCIITADDHFINGILDRNMAIPFPDCFVPVIVNRIAFERLRIRFQKWQLSPDLDYYE